MGTEDGGKKIQQKGGFITKAALCRAVNTFFRSGIGLGFTSDGLTHRTGAQATGTYAHGSHLPGRILVPHGLQVWIEAALGFNIGMAHKVANLGLFPAYFTLFRHGTLHNSLKRLR